MKKVLINKRLQCCVSNSNKINTNLCLSFQDKQYIFVLTKKEVEMIKGVLK